MENGNHYLLTTRPLPKSVIEEGAQKGVIIEELSFIATEPIQDEALRERIKNLAAQTHTVVFTSMTAVEAVADAIAGNPDWKIYSIGNTTQRLIEQKWGAEKLVATAENAQRLGEQLIDDGIKDLVFFCGNIRRDELPNKIRSEGGKIEEVVVYETEDTPSKVSRTYDGILFFSPSAVRSFYKQNKIPKETAVFAIGKTTAEALREHKRHNVILATDTDKVALAHQAIAFLTQT